MTNRFSKIESYNFAVTNLFKHKPCLGLALSLAMLAGCAGILDSAHIAKPKEPGIPTVASGGYYFLPRAKVRLEAERKPISAPSRKISLEKDVKKTHEVTSREQERDERVVKSTTTTTEHSTDSSTDTIESGACTLALKDVVMEPDPNLAFSLSHVRNIFGDDKVTVTLTPSGLLSKIDISAEDKSGEVVVKLGELAKEAAKASVGLPISPLSEDQKAKLPFFYSFLIDPTDTAELNMMNTALADVECNLQVALQSPQLPDQSKSLPQREASDEMPRGIFTRPSLPYTLIFETKDKSMAPDHMTVQNTVYLPNLSPIISIDIDRAAFVKYESTINFDNGTLKAIKIKKPSEALGFVSIPVDLAKEIVSIPGEIFKLKLDLKTQQTSELTSENELLKAQQELLEKQDELRKYLEGSTLNKEKPSKDIN